MKRVPASVVGIAGLTLALYVGVIAFGAWLKTSEQTGQGGVSRLWRRGRVADVAADRLASIELGGRLFDETPVYGAKYVTSRISCSNCHLEGGTAPFASPMVGIAGSFPVYSKRAGRAITLEDRIQECMTRSENGKPLPADSREMKGLLAYIGWLSEPHRHQAEFVGRGLKAMPVMVADASHGAAIYAAQCAGCHGSDGQGTRRAFPPLWGPTSFNDGAGMNGVDKMAAFVQVNMPHNRKGILSAQEAYDVAAFVHQQPRPAFNHEYDRY